MLKRAAAVLGTMFTGLMVAGLGLVYLISSQTPVNSQSNFVSSQLYCLVVGPPRNWLPCSVSNPLAVNASVSASISGFQPAATGTPITATTGGVTGTLPAGAVVAVFNTGTTNTAFCKLGASATTSDIAIPPASWFAYTTGGATQLTCITSTSTTTVNMVGGTGLPTGAGGGGGGGGGGAVTITSPLGTQAIAASVAVNPATSSSWPVTGTFWQATQPVSNAGTFAVQSAPSSAAAWGIGATASAVPANSFYQGINVAGNLRGSTGLALGSTFSQTIAIVDGSGNQVTSFGGSGGTASNFGSAFPTPGTAIGFTDGTNMVAGRSTASGADGVSNTLSGQQTYARIQCYNGSTWDRCTQVTPTSTTGNIAANNTTAVVVKASAGTLYGAQLANIGAVPAYLKIYDATSATCGSGTPVKRLIIPKAGTAADGGGSNVALPVAGITFATGITYCVTAGIADNDTTAPAASTVLVNLDWK